MPDSTSRPPIDRLLLIYNALHSGRKITTSTLGERLGLSDRTIKRYLRYMREDLGMKIHWDSNSKSYFCDTESEYLPLLRITGEEALSLTLASQTFAAWQGSALGKALDSILSKVATLMGGAVSLPVTDLESLLSVHNPDTSETQEHRWFGSALEAIRLSRCIRISYRKPDESRARQRTLWPLHLAHMEHHWALICWDPTKREPRKFLLSRMESLALLDTTFTPPESFNLRTYLSQSFGLFTGHDQCYSIRIHFDPTAAPFLRERKWHPSQSLEEQSDGSVIASYTLNHLMDIQRWVLSWGRHAEVLNPPELRDNLRSITHQLAQRYSVHPSRKQS